MMPALLECIDASWATATGTDHHGACLPMIDAIAYVARVYR
jgi:hypothetical protein